MEAEPDPSCSSWASPWSPSSLFKAWAVSYSKRGEIIRTCLLSCEQRKAGSSQKPNSGPLAWNASGLASGLQLPTPILVTKNVFISAKAKCSVLREMMSNCKGVSKYYVYKQSPQRTSKIQKSQKQLSGYKQCYTNKNQSLEVSKYVQSHSQTWAGGLRTRSLAILKAKPPLLKSCLRCYT